MTQQIHGTRQIKDTTVADGKLVVPYIKADGTRAFTGDQSHGGFKITSLGSPSSGTDAANKNYVDGLLAQLLFKTPVRAATTQALAFDSTDPAYSSTDGASGRGQITFGVGPTSIDGVTLVNGDRILVKNEEDSADLAADSHGIYVRTSANVWDRTTDFDADLEVKSGLIFTCEEGTANADEIFILITNNPIQIGGVGGTELEFVIYSDDELFIRKDGSVAFTGNQSLGGFKITSLGTPTADADAATKLYVDSQMGSFAIQKLSTTTGINAKTVGNTNIYTVPTGKTAIILGAVIRCTAAVSITTPAFAGIGIGADSTEDTICASQEMSGLKNSGDLYHFWVIAHSVIVPANEVVEFGIDTGAVGTSQTVAVDLIGYLL